MTSRHVKIAQGGRVVIPMEFRKALGVSMGDDVVIELKEGELRLRSRKAAIRHAQGLIRKYIPGDERSLVDELIAERRQAAVREDQ